MKKCAPFLFVFIATLANGQYFNIGRIGLCAGAGYTYYFPKTGGTPAYTFRAKYFGDEKRLTIGYSFSPELVYYDIGRAKEFSSFTYIPINIDRYYTFSSWFIHYEDMLIGDDEDPFGLYYIFGFFWTNRKRHKVVGDFDQKNYSAGESTDLAEISEWGSGGNVGLGAKYRFGIVETFAECMAGLPFTGKIYDKNGVGHDVLSGLPFSVGLVAGAFVRFGN